MTLITKMRVSKARRDAEKEIGYEVSDSFAEKVLRQCERKLACIKKHESYLPVLYRRELPLVAQLISISGGGTKSSGTTG